ncbi:hypothetical protein PR001_g23971 [Phytophthora rubi]|uniref:Uncharacterized protein n=1 Tax=Phytophthora rubi TaxID=129364 RepID=A0A6A3I5U6_9STRA|nr:hypothetical protein PR002_g24749 [Phytophthora rubi]KAE8981557.1 hypothetical protein PR001_g23971 [Phytophthora rubi]
MESDSAGVSTSLQDKEEATKKLDEIKQLPQKSVKAAIEAELRRKSRNPVFYLRDVVSGRSEVWNRFQVVYEKPCSHI